MMRRRILHIIYSLYRGGAERLIETQALTGNRELFEYLVCSITGGGDLAEAIESAGARVLLMHKRHRWDLTIIPRIARLIVKQRIDLLHLHNIPGTLWGTLASDLAVRRVPIVRTEHRPWIPERLPWVYRALYPYFMKRTARVICVSGFVQSTFVKRFPRFATKFVSVPNGVRIDAFRGLPDKQSARARFKLPLDIPVIGTVGRLEAVKNHRVLIDAFARVHTAFPRAHLAILGDGPLKESLASHAADLRLSNEVSFVKSTASAEVFLRCLDAFALSSDSEGMPLTLLEAMAAQVPVVATGVGGIPEVIEDGVDGRLVPRGSADALADAILSLLTPSEESAAMGRRGREKVERLFSAERTIGETERIYSEILGTET
jgi:glycosyltransferase involved in cell wall biosynthesis